MERRMFLGTLTAGAAVLGRRASAADDGDGSSRSA